MAYYPDPYGGGYYPHAWGPPATASPPTGEGNTIQFGTFPGLPEVQNFGPGYPQMPPGAHMYPPPGPYGFPPPHPVQQPPPPSNSNRGRSRHGRDKAPRHPPSGPPPGSAGGYPPPQFGMYPYLYAPGYAPQGFPPPQTYDVGHPYSRVSQRLNLEQQGRVPPQEASEATSPKSTTSTATTEKKRLALTDPSTGKEIGEQTSTNKGQTEKGSRGRSHAPPQNGSGPEIKPSPRTDSKSTSLRKPIITSEVKSVTVARTPSMEVGEKGADPKKPSRSEVVAKLDLKKLSDKEAGAPLALSAREKKHTPRFEPPPGPKSEARARTPKVGSPSKDSVSLTPTVVESKVVQVTVSQTQVPGKTTTDTQEAAKPEPVKAEEKKVPAEVGEEAEIVKGTQVVASVEPPVAEQPFKKEPDVPKETKREPEAPAKVELAPPEKEAEEKPEEEGGVKAAREQAGERKKETTVPVAEEPPPEGPPAQKEAEKKDDSAEQASAEAEPEQAAEAKPAATEATEESKAESGNADVSSSRESNEAEDADPKSSADGEKDEEKESPRMKRKHSMELLQELRARNTKPPDNIDLGPCLKTADSGSTSLKERESLSRRGSGKSNSGRSGSADKSWRGLTRGNSGRMGSRVSRVDDAEIFHKPSGNRKYSLDFMRMIQEKCPEKPPEALDGSHWKDSIGTLKSRGSERAGGGRWSVKNSFDERERGAARSSSVTTWGKESGSGRQFSGRGSFRSARPGHGNVRGIDDDRWQKGGVPMSPFGASSPAGAGLHHAEERYVIGTCRTEDPEEEKRQKRYKAVLNKLTPDNFDKMYEELKAVEVKEHKTLEGLIDQIFDKALTETTFCPLYANLCKQLMTSMPEFDVEGDSRKVTFRRLLLNKCQAEFEKGDAAMRAAEEVEKEEDKSSDEARQKIAQAKKERIRSLGNMQFIGHLFSEGMLTEKIIHQCIVHLLREQDKPKPEDIECLCKLLSTVGKHLTECKALDAYFNRIQRLTTENKNLDTRHKFMLLDLIELKQRNWVTRRKAEGPKKIQDIHQEAAQEQINTRRGGGGSGWGGLPSRNSRGMDRDRGGPGWSRSGGPSAGGRNNPGPAPAPTYDNIQPLSRMKSLGRTNSDDISLRPPSQRPIFTRPSRTHAPAPIPERRSTSRSRSPPKVMQTAAQPATAPAKPEEQKPAMEADALKLKCKGFLQEYYHTKDIEEAIQSVQELAEKGAAKEDIVATCISQALDLKVTVDERLEPLAGFFGTLLQKKVMETHELRKGLEDALASVPDMAEDFPKAPDLLARMIGDLAIKERIPVFSLAKMILTAGKDQAPPKGDTPLVDSGYASTILLGILRKLKGTRPIEDIKVHVTESKIINFYPSYDRDSVDVEKALGFLDEN